MVQVCVEPGRDPANINVAPNSPIALAQAKIPPVAIALRDCGIAIFEIDHALRLDQ